MLQPLALCNFRRAPWPLLFATAGLGHMLFAYNAKHMTVPAFCGTANGLENATQWARAMEAAIMFNRPYDMLVDWSLMLLAMMPPLLAMPLMHVWRASLKGRRMQASAEFLLAYCIVWIAAGLLLTGLALLVQLAAVRGTLASTLLLALLWSASPWHFAALNRGHRLRRIGLFGWHADRDCMMFGATHGIWCIASCWAWMLVPLVAGSWHIYAMLITSAIMLAERLSAPSSPRWTLPLMFKIINTRSLFLMRKTARSHG